MPFLSTNKFGAGPLYDYTTADRNAYLTQGTTYFQTDAAGWAIQQDVFDSTFVLAGEIGSNGIGVRVTTNDGSRIDITRTGYLSADGDGIFIRATGAFFLTNSGTIVSNHDAIVMDDIVGSRLLLTNTGTIQGKSFTAIVGSPGVDSIDNTGSIVGPVRLNDGADRIDTHLGTISGFIYGGDGDDSYTIAGTERLSEDPGGGNDGVTSYGDYALAANIERLTLVGAATTGWGNAIDNTLSASERDCGLFGRGGDDVLYGGQGDDQLSGGVGDDTLNGGAGDNRLFGRAGDDTLYADGGDNIMDGGAGADYIYANLGSDTIAGGVGVDTLDYGTSAAAVIVNLATSAAAGGAAEGDTISGIENLGGSAFADRLTGDVGDNRLAGLNGNDELAGGAGDDVLRGGVGADVLNGGAGSDTVDYADTFTAVTIDLAAGAASGNEFSTGDSFVSIENVTGGGAGDTLTGSSAANVLRGGGGDDTLFGGGGADTLVGGNGDDSLYGQNGADVLLFADIVAGTPGGWDTDLVYGFADGIDKISFIGASAIHSMADLTLSVVGGDVLISTNGGADLIRLVGFPPASLDASDFIFA